jgi:serine/threonine protein kinase
MRKTIGKFEVQHLIAKGATSNIYLAKDPFNDQEVAIKLANQAVFDDPVNGYKFQKMFINEASLAGKMRHPHIVSVYDAGSDEDDLKYIVMEYINGKTLEQYCKPDSLLPFDSVIEIIFKCCSALDYAVHHGVIHRDIKPANILVVEGNDVKISDFGTALMENSDLTQIVDPVGSPAYMSPEHIQGEDITHQADIYSLGVVMYRMLCGRLPFKSKHQPDLIRKIVKEEPTPLQVLRSDVPEILTNIVEKCIKKDLGERYQTWDELQKDLVSANNQLEMPSKDVSDTKRFDILQNLTFFSGFSDVELWEVVRISKWHKFPAEKALIMEGKIGGSLFILASGDARIMIGEANLGNIEEGQCFGEMAYIQGKRHPRSASVISNSDVLVIKIRADALHEASTELQNSIDKVLLSILSERLEKTSIMAAMI